MALFRVYLVGNPLPIDVDLPVHSAAELSEIASRARFIEGHMSDADGDGVCACVLIPTCRIHFILETS